MPDKIIPGFTKGSAGFVGGLPCCVVVVNGDHNQERDQWGLFRLTDEGLVYYREGFEFRAGIMSMLIDEKPAVEEIFRHDLRDEVAKRFRELSQEEQGRTLIRSVKRRTNDPLSFD